MKPRKHGGGMPKKEETKTYSIRAKKTDVESAKINHKDLQQKGKDWIKKMAKGKDPS